MKRPSFPNFYRYLRSRIAPRPRARTSRDLAPLPTTGEFCSLPEALEARIAPAAALVGAGMDATVVVTGDDGVGGVPFDDQFTLRLNAGALNLDVFQNGVLVGSFPLATYNKIDVQSFDGNDTVTVDYINGNPVKAGGLKYDGGAHFNSLNLINGTETSDVHTAGPNVGQGRIALTVPGVNGASYNIDYFNLAPVNDILNGPLTISGTPAENAINYAAGIFPAGFGAGLVAGRITIDNFEPVLFSNKTTLTINGFEGSDYININNSSIPTQLTAITVNGGDPTGSDRLVVNGVVGAQDALRHNPTGLGAGTVVNDGPAVQRPVTFTGVEHLRLVVQEGAGDEIRIEGTAGNDRFEFTHGASADSGVFTGTMDENNATGGGPFRLTETTFTGVAFGVSDVDVNFFVPGGTDTFVFNGTAASDNIVLGPFLALINTVNGDQISNFELFNFASILLRGHDGDDNFSVATTVAPLTINIDAGNPGGSDTALIQGSTGADTIVTALGPVTSTVTMGTRIVNLVGVEDVTVDALGGLDTLSVTNFGALSNLRTLRIVGGANADTLAVSTTTGDDSIQYTPATVDSGALAANGLAPALSFAGVTGVFSLDPLAGVDSLTVRGSDVGEAATAVLAAAGNNVQIGTTKQINASGATLERLELDLRAGIDSLTISGVGGGALLSVIANTGDGNDGTTIDFAAGNPLPTGGLTLDGGLGIDSLTLQNNTATFDAYTPGPIPGAGNIAINVAAALRNINFVNLEPVIDLVAGPLVVNATPASNAVAYTAGAVVANGRVTIDDQEFIEFSNKTTLTINALAGNDVVSLNNPNTPTGLTGITVNGGDPTGDTDTLVIQDQNAATAITYTPTGANAGTIAGADTVTVTAATIEALRIVGTGALTTMTVVGSAGDEIFEATPSTIDALRVSTSVGGARRLAVDVENFNGISSTVTLDGAGGTDRIVYNGLSSNDVLVVDGAGAIDHTSVLGAHILVAQANVEALTLNALEGDDTITIAGAHPYTGGILVHGGSPSASDVLNFTSTAATTVDFSLQTVAQAGSGAVTFNGVETLNVNGADAVADSFTVLNYGLLTDVQNLTLNGGDTNNNDGDTIDLSLTAQPETLQYTPLSTSTGRFERAEGGPRIDVIGFNNTDDNLSVDGLGNLDALHIVGNTNPDRITVAAGGLGTRVTLEANLATKWVPIDFTSLEALVIDSRQGADQVTFTGTGPTLASALVSGGDGDDTFTVDFAAGNPIPTGGISLDGGLGRDSLTLINNTATADTYTPGLTVGSGTIDITVAALARRINFANFEPVIDLVAGPLVVNGTPSSNAIAYTQGAVAANGRVTIDDHESIEFSNKTTLVINALAGSDTISINNPSTPTGLTGITVNGGDSTADTDTVIVQDQNAATAITYTPSGTDSGLIDGADTVPVTVATTEALFIRGQGGNVGMTVVGTAGNDTLTYTPGPSIDSGVVRINNGAGASSELLGVTFNNFGATGTLTLSGGAGGTDTIVYNGTGSNDTITVAATTGTIDLTSPLGNHIDVLQTSVEVLSLNTLDGDDVVTLNFPTPYTSGITVSAGDPSASDVLFLNGAVGVVESVNISPNAADATKETITGLGTTITSSGVEVIRYTGSGTDDTLTVNLGAQSNVARVEGGVGAAGIDEVTSDSLPKIEFTGLSVFVIDPAAGHDEVTFATAHLGGAVPANYRITAGTTDVLTIEGFDSGLSANDSFTVTRPGAGSVAVAHNNAVAGVVTVTETTGQLSRLQLNTRGGDDNVTVSVAGTALITVPITYDGGSGEDALTVSGTPTTAVATETYTPGPIANAGRLQYAPAAGASMIIDFTGLEPVIDSVPAAALAVNGDDNDNAISYTSSGANGLVTVDNNEGITFTNKVNLVLNGLGGDDVISINPTSTPTGLTGISANGGDPTASDTLVMTGNSGGDTFTLVGTSGSSGTATITGEVPVAFTGIEATVFDGQGGADLFEVGTLFGNVTVIGGDGSDTISFAALSTLDPMLENTRRVIFDLRELQEAQRPHTGDLFVTLGDRVECFIGTRRNDILTVEVASYTQLVDGNDPQEAGVLPVPPNDPVPPGDTLNIDGNGAALSVVFSSANDGVATGFGYNPINFISWETVRTFNTAGGGSGGPGSSGGTGSTLSDGSFDPAIYYELKIRNADHKVIARGVRPRAIDSGDIDGDGDVDLLVTARHHKFAVFLNDGTGDFELQSIFTPSGGKRSNAIALGNFDADPALELAVANGLGRSISIYDNAGGGAFTLSSTIPIPRSAISLTIGDVSNDGDPDIIVGHKAARAVTVLLGGAGLAFGGATTVDTGGFQPRSVAIADVNEDGDPDLLAVNTKSNTLAVLIGNGAGGFAPATTLGSNLFKTGRRPDSLVVGDFDQDGHIDAAIALSKKRVLVTMLGDGSGGFERQVQARYPIGVAPQAIASGDFNFDGKLDVVLGNRVTNTVFFLLGSGNGTFLTQLKVKVGDIARLQPAALTVADFNGDGALDLATANFGTNDIAVLLRNI